MLMGLGPTVFLFEEKSSPPKRRKRREPPRDWSGEQWWWASVRVPNGPFLGVIILPGGEFEAERRADTIARRAIPDAREGELEIAIFGIPRWKVYQWPGDVVGRLLPYEIVDQLGCWSIEDWYIYCRMIDERPDQ